MTIPRTRQHVDPDPEDHDRGLGFDLQALVSRRRALHLLAAGGVVLLTGCVGGSSTRGTTTAPATTAAGADTATTAVAGIAEVPEETAGPFPADGSNGPDVLTESGVVRRDITRSVGSSSGRAEGVPLAVELTILDVAAGGVPRPGAAVYAWHCDRDGNYSLYSAATAGENYLRGVQVADDRGRLRFDSVFPGCYPGRWPHIHFEVYPGLAEATGGGRKMVTSQIALPEDACRAAYGTAGYEASLAALGGVSLETDMVFSDGWSTQLGTVTGTPAGGMTVRLNVGV